MSRVIRRLCWLAILAAALVAACGAAAEVWRFGTDPDAARRRLERDVRDRFDQRTAAVRSLAQRVARDSAAAVAAAAREPDELPALFDRLARLAPSTRGTATPTTVTVYLRQPEAQYRILAWSDGPTENVGPDRLGGEQALFAAPGTMGLRLVSVEPILHNGQRFAAAAAETVLAPKADVGQAGTYRFDAAFGPVTLQFPGITDAGMQGDSFAVPTSDGRVINVEVSPAGLAAARLTFRRRVMVAAALPLLAAALLLTGVMVGRRRQAASSLSFLAWSAAASVLVTGLLLAVERLADLAGAPLAAGITLRSLAAVIAVVLVPVSWWWRGTARRRRAASPVRFVAEHCSAGAVVAACSWLTASILHNRITPAALAQAQVPLFQMRSDQIVYVVGLVLVELALCWLAAATLGIAAARWRLRIREARTWMAAVIWFVPAAVLLLIEASALAAAPGLRWLPAAAAIGAFALFGRRWRLRYRQTTQAMRLLLLYAALLIPVVVLYPIAWFFADHTAREIVALDYAPATARLPDDTFRVLTTVQQEIDRIPLSRILPLFSVAPVEAGDPVPTVPAFEVWSQTSLASRRLTGAVELFTANGALASRFALNVPQYRSAPEAAVRSMPSTCGWSVYGEAVPFGAEERDMLHARRLVCDASGHAYGAILVHVINDYQALPFVSTPDPYREVLGAQPGAAGGPVLPDLQVVVYGWSFTPLFTSGHVAWPITADLFRRLYASREPFWTRLTAEDRFYDVYFSNDSRFIYALGYPSSTWFQHLARLAEAAALVAGVFVLWLLGAAAYAPFVRPQAAPLRRLLDEIRTSFYRKLFLLFVLAAVGPVLLFALAFGVYMDAKLRGDVEKEASTVVTVARRVLEQSAVFGSPAGSLNDDVMVWIGQVVHQDVNLFEGPELVATSQRDLYASGLLPTRTPASVYRAIALNRLPTFVGEAWLGPFRYVLAAAPMPAAGREFVLSVPLASRQREIEREIDELNRGVLVGAVLVVLFAAGLGASVASRVSDPVARLSRAARQIAAGRLDVRLVAETADELSRLIDDFNSMAATLRAQRDELARANQLKAWAEMARQVAHEIKNPLTPIQLAAEHLDHVHADRGRPLGPVFDQCVATVLRQVRLLRQIAGEFSTFAGQPTPRFAAISPREIIEEVVRPYRVGLGPQTTIDVEVPEDLPHVAGDRTLLARAFTNLVENAMQAMPHGGRLSISASAAPDTGAVVLAFADTGVGMDANAAARAFEPYFSTKTAGSGLGLANARRNIEMCGGAIRLTSEPGRGTTITVTLPRHDPRGGPAAGSTPGR